VRRAELGFIIGQRSVEQAFSVPIEGEGVTMTLADINADDDIIIKPIAVREIKAESLVRACAS